MPLHNAQILLQWGLNRILVTLKDHQLVQQTVTNVGIAWTNKQSTLKVYSSQKNELAITTLAV